MVRLLVIVACLFFAGCSSTNNGLRSNGQVSVTGEGRTFEEAKNNGFARAVEIAVGAVLLTDTQVKNDKLVKDEIIKHSAGYVEEFTVTNKTIGPGSVTLQMDVKVKSSKIAERVLGTQKTQGAFAGSQVKAQYDTYSKDRKTGDAVLNKVLSDYPYRAYTIKQRDKAEFRLNKYRDMFIIIPFEVRWNYKYLTALKEALDITQDGYASGYNQDVISIQNKDPNAWILGSTDRYYFNDRIRADKIAGRFLGRITVVAEVKDDDGNVIFQGCEEAFHNGVNIVYPNVVKGNQVAYDTVQIEVKRASPNYWKLDKANKIELSITTGECYNYIQ